MMCKVAIVLAAAAIGIGGSTLSASAIPGGGGGESAIHSGGEAYFDLARWWRGRGLGPKFGHRRFGFRREILQEGKRRNRPVPRQP
jgi:hypothetical protein